MCGSDFLNAICVNCRRRTRSHPHVDVATVRRDRPASSAVLPRVRQPTAHCDVVRPGWARNSPRRQTLQGRGCFRLLWVCFVCWLLASKKKVISPCRPSYIVPQRIAGRGGAALGEQIFGIHCKSIRISTDILWWVFYILTEPVPYTFVSVNRCNNI